jgi:hypothetical protein
MCRENSWTAVFLVFGFVSAQSQGFQTCSFAEASPKPKNPRCTPPHLFCQCSKKTDEAGQNKVTRLAESILNLADFLSCGLRPEIVIGRRLQTCSLDTLGGMRNSFEQYQFP